MGRPPPPALPHVALLIETSRSYGRGVLRGVRDYLAEHRPWSVYLEPRALDSAGPPWLRGWKGDGVLTRTATKSTAALVRAARVPTVELRSARLMPGVPWVGVDNRALGRLVAAHLLDRGFRQLAVYALDGEPFFAERCDDFAAAARDAGRPCAVYRAGAWGERPADWERHQAALARWVQGLPKPAGVMACTDQLGFWLLDACRRAGVTVPDEVAVVGVEDEESLCAMAGPPLSSVRLPTERVGYEAAAILDRLMAGKKPPRGPVLFPPVQVVVRQSSDAVAVPDEAVAAAVRFIRDRACDGATVDDLLAAVPLSRSGLERGFRKALGRSPHAEIRRVRLARVCQLLADTDLPLATIAARSGFASVPYLCAAFKAARGATPTEFRAAARR